MPKHKTDFRRRWSCETLAEAIAAMKITAAANSSELGRRIVMAAQDAGPARNTCVECFQ